MMNWKSIAAVVLCGMCSTGIAQQQSTPQQPQDQQQDAPKPSNPNAKILFHRSDEDAAQEDRKSVV